MNIKELKKKFDELGIPQSSYSLYGGNKILIPIIGKKNGKWFIYEFDERGNHYQQYCFDQEEDICERFYQRVVKDNEFREGNYKPKPTGKEITVKFTKKGDMITFLDGVPIAKNGVEIRTDFPILLNGAPVQFNDDDDMFDDG
jgi:hypothetical protein